MNRQELLAVLTQLDMIHTLATREGKEIPSVAEKVLEVEQTLLDALNVTYA